MVLTKEIIDNLHAAMSENFLKKLDIFVAILGEHKNNIEYINEIKKIIHAHLSLIEDLNNEEEDELNMFYYYSMGQNYVRLY